MVYDYCKACLCRADKCLVPDSHRAQQKIVWCVDFLLGGSHGKRIRKQLKPGVTKKEAEKYEVLTRADFERGTFLPSSKTNTAFNDVVDRYYRECIMSKTRGNTSSNRFYQRRIKQLLGHHAVGLIKLETLEEARRQYRESSKANNPGINRLFSIIKTVCNRAVEWGYMTRSPGEYLRDLPETPTIPRFLTVEEINRFRSCIKDQRLDDYVTVLLHTGIRPIDIKDLTWDKIDRDSRTINVTTHKGRIPHTYPVPIDDELWPVIQRRYEKTKGFGRVFDTLNIRKLGDQAIKDSGINETRPADQQFTIYGLKHCYASHLLMNGATMFDVAKLLGHTDMVMVIRHYGFLTQQHLRQVQAKINLTPKLIPQFKVI